MPNVPCLWLFQGLVANHLQWWRADAIATLLLMLLVLLLVLLLMPQLRVSSVAANGYVEDQPPDSLLLHEQTW